MDHALFLINCLVWGTSFILMDRASLSYGPISIGALGTLGGGLVLATEWWRRGQGSGLDRAHLAPLIPIIIIGYCCPFAIQPYVIERVGHGYVGTSVCLVPLMTIALSIPILKKHPSRVQSIGVVTGLAFLGFFFADGFDRAIAPADLALIISIPFSYALTNVLVKRFMVGIPPIPLGAVCLLGAGLMLLPFGLTLEQIAVNGDFLAATLSLLALAVLSRGLCTGIFYRLVQHRGPLYAGMVSYVIPFVVLLWSALDQETVTGKQLIAVIGTLSVVFAVQRDISNEKA